MRRRLTFAAVFVCVLSCRQTAQPPGVHEPPADEGVRQLADAYLDGYFARNPDQATIYGVPGRQHDKLPDNSLDALAQWHAREDAWRTTAAAINPAAIASPSLQATYAIVREALEGSIAARPCRNELWTVSQMVNGWQVQFGYLVTIQPIGTDTARSEALVRWSALPSYIDTEIGNLRQGLERGYSAPKANVPPLRNVSGTCAARLHSSTVERPVLMPPCTVRFLNDRALTLMSRPCQYSRFPP